MVKHSSVKELKESIVRHLRITLARDLKSASKKEIWMATCYAVRDRIVNRFIQTQERHGEVKSRRVYYLSLEYLMGRLLLYRSTHLKKIQPSLLKKR